jgi:hypothetical protein
MIGNHVALYQKHGKRSSKFKKEGISIMESLGIVSVAGITIICYLIGYIVKEWTQINNDRIPSIMGVAGAVLGVIGMFVMPDFPAADSINALAVGIVSGFAATGIN